MVVSAKKKMTSCAVEGGCVTDYIAIAISILSMILYVFLFGFFPLPNICDKDFIFNSRTIKQFGRDGILLLFLLAGCVFDDMSL